MIHDLKEFSAQIGRIAYVIIVFMLIMAGLIFSRTMARAHEAISGFVYPAECCANYDCAEIASTRVKVSASGYLVDGRFWVQHSEVKFSPDGHYHACFPNPEMLRCLFIPPSGS